MCLCTNARSAAKSSHLPWIYTMDTFLILYVERGKVLGGMKLTPCGGYMVYPLGAILVVRTMTGKNKQVFLEGHTSEISCVAMSADGTRIVSGQANHMGVKADLCVWDLVQAQANCDAGRPSGGGVLLHRLKQHLGHVRALDFSFDGKYFASLGGQDDNSVVIWEMETGRAVCGSPAAQDSAFSVKWLHRRNDRFVTAGNFHLRVWQVDVSIPKVHAVDAQMGGMRRTIECISITEDDKHAYCGTRTGDVLKFKIDRDDIRYFNDPDTIRPTLAGYSLDKFGKGVRSVCCVLNPETGNTNTLVGGGDGTVSFINQSLNKVAGKHCELMGAVTSIAMCPGNKGFFVGTSLSNRYWVTMDMETELRGTCHFARVNDIIFPAGCSDLFITCSVADIRVWNATLRQELLRIQVPNLECFCVGITRSGGTIVSGWSDGKIRAFYPESGKLKFVISDAHAEGATAVALAHDDDTRPPWRVISGGGDGRVRVWSVTSSHQTMNTSWKEHRGPVTCIQVSRENGQCISGSADGSCIVWDLNRGVRVLALFEPNVFKGVRYHPDESQYITCGSNHKITYWDAYDGTAIRVIEGGEEEMNTLDVEPSGELFVSGGDDGLVKVWHYDDGLTMNIGSGHSGRVAAVRISPDRKIIASVGSEGGIFIWGMPPPSHADARGPSAAVATGIGCTMEAAGGANLDIDNLADDVSRVSMMSR
ncbi:unnamed protein product [Pylaiella littoralis]